MAVEALRTSRPAVLALGGGALGSSQVRDALRERAFTVSSRSTPDEAWSRVRDTGRPLAQDELDFRALFTKRAPVYAQAADATASEVDERRSRGRGGPRRSRLARAHRRARARRGDAALVGDARVAGIHGADAQVALGGRLVSVHELPEGEEAKTVDAVTALWRELRLDRTGVLVALGGGCTTDAAGFAAATYLRGIRWVAVPTTLVGQVDAAIGGKTAIDLAEGKNLVGAFHWPARTVIDPTLLATLPERERREGLAEVVKTGLLMGESLWELPDAQLVRASAAYKARCACRTRTTGAAERPEPRAHLCPCARGGRGLRRVTHGSAVALGLLAALRLSGLDTSAVEESLRPEPRAGRSRPSLGRAPARQEGERPRAARAARAPRKPVYGAERPGGRGSRRARRADRR